ncbi:MAG: PQQ-binding-like beta-propeller repeat protein [Actinomycetales bacterium]|nr:PQQ-binding-like beta-propeller repeat protein [Actinomycetales bacterium]
MSAPVAATRGLQVLLVAQAILIASPITTLDNLLTAPRAVGAQAARADVAATITSSVPLLTSLVPVVLLLVAMAVQQRSRGSLITAGVFSLIGLTAAGVPALRDATFAAKILHGIPLGLTALGALVLVARMWPQRTRDKQLRHLGRRATAVLATGFVILAGLGAVGSTIPSAPVSGLLAKNFDFTTSEPTAAFDSSLPAQNAFLAPNPDSNIHHDGAMTDAYFDRGVLDPRKAEVVRRHLGGVCASIMVDSAGRLVAVCVNPTKVVLHVLDPQTLEVLARKHVADRPFRTDFATNFAGGGYAVLDEQQRVVLPTSDGRITRWSTSNAAGKPEITQIDEFDVSSLLLHDEGINSALPDASGYWWIVGQLGSVGVLNTETGEVAGTRFPGADIENSFAVGKRGGAYIVTSKELVFAEVVDGKPSVTWSETYDQGTRRKPGQTSRASGTTPTLLLDERFVAITDNADPRVNVLVYDTDPVLAQGTREVCRVPVFVPNKSATDNSLIAMGGSLFVENNYGYNLLSATNGRSSEPGMTRIDVAEDGSDCETVWENTEIRVPSVVSKGSTTGVIVSYTREDSIWGIDAWYFTALDATTGEVMWRKRAGSGPMVNNHYAATYLGPNGEIYTGATGGLVALVPRT